MKIKNVVIPVAGVIASVLIAFSVPAEHQVYLAEFAGLVAIALGVWVARCESKKPKYLPVFHTDDKGVLRLLFESQERSEPEQTPDQPWAKNEQSIGERDGKRS